MSTAQIFSPGKTPRRSSLKWRSAQPLGRYLHIAITGLALFGLLAYTFTHTGALLSRYITPGWVGYLAALGIELAIVALSVRIGEIKKVGQNPWFFYGVLIGVLVVSAIANLAEGFFVNQGVALTVNTAVEIDVIQAIIALTAPGLIPVIVFALSEIVGTDVNAAAKIVQKQRQAERPKVSAATGIKPTPEQARLARGVKAEQDALSKGRRLDTLVDTLAQQPDVGPTRLATLVGVSRTTIYSDLDELVNAGRLTKNGQGWQVVG